MNKIIFITLVFTASLLSQTGYWLVSDVNYPRWMKNNEVRSNQTSGIAFLGRDETGKSVFLIADDIGDIYRFTIENDTIFNFTLINFSSNANSFLNTLPKKDFEEITFDPYLGLIYISIEGNGEDFKEHAGIYRLHINSTPMKFDTVRSFEKIEFQSRKQLYANVRPNIAFEGFAVDENYFYLGLEGILVDTTEFGNGTFIYIYEKKNKNLSKIISTKELGIQTVCGLFSNVNNSIWGVDRNKRKIFRITFDDTLEVKSHKIFNFIPVIPGYSKLNYVASIESITMDDKNNLYVVDDPWKEYYIPPRDVLFQVDKDTENNFKSFIPIIYRYNLKSKY